MRRTPGVLAGLGLLVLAFGVAYSVPGNAQLQAPFVVSGQPGEQIVAQNLVVTVHDSQFAGEVVVGGWRGTTSGVWLVVDATVEARTERTGLDVDVFVDDVRYAATARISTDVLSGSVVDAGFPVTGAVLVELPADIVERPGARSATLRFSPGPDPRLASVIELELDLTSLQVDARVQRDPPRDGPR